MNIFSISPQRFLFIRAHLNATNNIVSVENRSVRESAHRSLRERARPRFYSDGISAKISDVVCFSADIHSQTSVEICPKRCQHSILLRARWNCKNMVAAEVSSLEGKERERKRERERGNGRRNGKAAVAS